jgi:hypothetical protein
LRAARLGIWALLCGLVVLGARAIAYALAPGPDALALQQRVGGPALPVVACVALLLGLALSAGVVWVAWSAVRERHALSDGTAPLPALRPARLALTAPLLCVASCAAFTGLESYVHAQAGLGVHGLSCLFGPVHQNAVPVLAALSLLAAAFVLAAEHVLAWARRTVRVLLAGRQPRRPRRAPLPVAPVHTAVVSRPHVALAGPRAPPRLLSA